MKCLICKNKFRSIGNQKTCSKECSILNFKKYMKQYRLNNKIKLSQYFSNWRIQNKKLLNHYQQKYRKSIEGIYSLLRTRSGKKNYNFSITIKDFINWYNKQEQKCYYCKRTLLEILKDKMGIKKIKRLTIDRINNKKGYIFNNMVLACFRCNTIKSNYFTKQEMLTIGKIIKHKK